ncbi:hypothetical protein SDD30_16245 [Moorella naiadis]
MREAQEKNADAVVLSPALPGEGDFIAGLIFPLRRHDIRIILLPGKIDEYDVRVLVARAIHYGVFDVIYDPVNAEKILERLRNPASYAKASEGIEIDLLQRQEEWLEKLETAPSETKDEEEMEKAEKDEKDGKTGEKKKGRDSPRIRFPKIPGLKLRKPRVRPEGSIEVPSLKFVVWSPTNFLMSFTAFNLAVAAAKYNLDVLDVALLNFNVAAPETDYWFGVRQDRTSCRLEDAGLATLADAFSPDFVTRVLELKRDWGVKYLPVGNKLINIGTPDFPPGEIKLFEDIIQKAAAREARRKKITIVEAGSWFEHPPAYAALQNCDLIVIPFSGSLQEAALVEQQLGELRRLDVKAEAAIISYLDSEVKIRDPAGVAPKIIIPLNMDGYLKSSLLKKPYCLLNDATKAAWINAVNALLC